MIYSKIILFYHFLNVSINNVLHPSNKSMSNGLILFMLYRISFFQKTKSLDINVSHHHLLMKGSTQFFLKIFQKEIFTQMQIDMSPLHLLCICLRDR